MKARGPMLDLKVWTFTIRRQVEDLTDQIDKCDAIIKILEKLQKDVAAVKAKLDTELDNIKNRLESSVKVQQAKMKDLE